MTHPPRFQARIFAACLTYILISPVFLAPVLAAPEIVSAPAAPTSSPNTGSTPLGSAGTIPIIENAATHAPMNLDNLNATQPAAIPLYWRLDKTGRLTPEEVLSPAQQSFFVSFPPVEIPRMAGTSWFRFSIAPYTGSKGPYYLDLNSRVDGQIPKGHRVWLLREGQPHVQLHTEIPGLYLLPDSAVSSTIFVRTEGLPAVGFAPSLRSASTISVLDTDGSFWIGVLLAVSLIFGLLRGIFEQREWRMWAALYAGTLLVTNAWGFPATPDGRVLLLDLPGLLAPGIALLLLPHVGRHILRSREHSTAIDIQFILIGLLGLVLCLLPMLSNHVWTIRYLPLWPLGMLLLLPTTLQAMFQKINGSGRFLTICLLPPLGLLSFAPLPLMQFTSAEDAGLWSATLSLLPSLCLCASSLLIALAPTPKHELKAKHGAAGATAATGTSGANLVMLGKNGPESPLRLEPTAASAMATPPLVLDDASRMAPPADLDSALPLHNLERRMRGPLDVLLNEVGTLEQMNLPRDLVDHAHRLSRASRQLSLLIGEISSGRHGSPVVVRQKSEMETASVLGHAAPFDLYDVILQAHNAVAELAEAKNLALSWFTAPHLARSYNGQGGRLLRVLTLLAESAVHATDRGIVQIRVQRLPESNDPGLLLFTVSDTGKGAPPLQRSSISLVQVWELVGPTGGTLNVESGPTGTSIAFSTRFQALSAESSSRSLRDAASPSLRSEMCNALRILVVSDVPGSRQLLNFYLDELPHEVREARSVDEALGMYMQAPGALLIFDGDLPEADVVRTVAAIRAFEGEQGYPLSSILALVKDDEQIERLRRAGCTHSLLKPVSRTELRQLALRLAPVPRSRAQHKPESTAPLAVAATASPSKAAPSYGVDQARADQNRKAPWSKKSQSSQSSLGSQSSLSSLSSPSALSMTGNTSPEASAPNARPDSPLSLGSPSTVSKPVALASPKKPPLPLLPELHVSKPEPRPAPEPKPEPAKLTDMMPVPEFAPQAATPTSQILHEMVRDAEEKVAEGKLLESKNEKTPTPVQPQPDSALPRKVDSPKRGWKLKPRPVPVSQPAVATNSPENATAERKPMPWPGTIPRRPDMEQSTPSNSINWESDSKLEPPRAEDSPQSAALPNVANSQNVLNSTGLADTLEPTLAGTPQQSRGFVSSLLSVFKKKSAHPTPVARVSARPVDEWVGEPRPVRPRDPKPAPTAPVQAERATQEKPTTGVPAFQTDGLAVSASEWVGEPRPILRHTAEQAQPEHEQQELVRHKEVLQAPSSASLDAEDPLAPVDFAEIDKPMSTLEPLPQTETIVSQTESASTQIPAEPARMPETPRKLSRKVTFQPLMLPGLELNKQDNPVDSDLELRFPAQPQAVEEIFDLTEIVDDSANLPELPLDSTLKTHQHESSPLYLNEDGTVQPKHETVEVAEVPDFPAPLPDSLADSLAEELAQSQAPASNVEPELAALRRLPGTPLPNNPGLELVEMPDESSLQAGGTSSDEATVEQQLLRLVTLSANAQEAFVNDNLSALRESAAELANTATALGLHGLIDLARCLEEVVGDPEATASLLETIETAVRDETL